MSAVAEVADGHPGHHGNQTKKVTEKIPATFLQTLAMKTVCQGATPKHVAFIMDGNRRYARENGLKSVTDGHRLGRETLHLMLDRCFDMGVTDVTVYALSIENFKRSKVELDGLFTLLHEEIDGYFQHQGRYFGIRMIGDISRFPPDLRAKMAKHILEEGTHYTQWLNVCLAYTSRAEMTNAIKELRWGVRKGFIRPEDVNQSLLESCFWAASLPPVDLLVRTSGEIRLSDFLTWQAGLCPLVFTETLWPAMNAWSLFNTFIIYQRNVEKTERERQLYLKRREQEEEQYLQNLARTLNEVPTSCREARKARVDEFLQNLAEKRHEQLREFVSTDFKTTQTQEDRESLKDFMDIYDDLQSLDCKKSYNEVKSFFLDATGGEGFAKEKMEKLIDYNITGMLALFSKLLTHVSKLVLVNATKEELYQGEIIGWLIAMIGVGLQISDDICDKSSVREGKPCWYLLPEVGMTAVLDSTFIFSCIPLAVHHFFKDHPCYRQIAIQFNKGITEMTMGQYLDNEDNHIPGSLDIDMEKMTWERYRRIIGLKASCRPAISLGLFLVQETNERLHNELVKYGDRASFHMQLSDDYYDVFPPPGVSMGNDIEEGKVTWCICTALDKASPEQKKILEENYGKKDKQSVKTVKKIFQKLNLKKDFDEYKLYESTPEKEKEAIDRLLSETTGNRICGKNGIPWSVVEVCQGAFKLCKKNYAYLESGHKHI